MDRSPTLVCPPEVSRYATAAYCEKMTHTSGYSGAIPFGEGVQRTSTHDASD